MSKTPEILLIGCGKLGKPLAINLAEKGFVVTVFRRSQETLNNMTTVVGNVLNESDFNEIPKKKFNTVFYILTPSEYNAAGYREVFETGVANVLSHFENSIKPERIIFISSTRVYGQGNKEWVDEASETKPNSWAGQSLVNGETLFLQSNIDSTVVRFAGIYGGERNRLINKVKSGKISYWESECYSNRIHSDDCIGFLTHLAQCVVNKKPIEDIYIGVDDKPAPIDEVMKFIADELSVTVTEVEKESKPSKRCENKALSLSGYKLKYPDYQSGYRKILQ